jgi:hypothetical protein
MYIGPLLYNYIIRKWPLNKMAIFSIFFFYFNTRIEKKKKETIHTIMCSSIALYSQIHRPQYRSMEARVRMRVLGSEERRGEE